MSVGELAMFGKAYDTVGSTNKNLILQTRGDLKIRWGNKFIDLIKNGKTIDKAECYDNHLSFDFNTGVDSGILGINEPMLSMTIQRY